MEKKLTDEEIIKALECCAMISVNPHLRGECIACPYFQKHIDCVEGKRSEMDCIDLIHRLQEENELKTAQVGLLTEQVEFLKNCGDNFLADYEKAQKQVDKQKAEIERLTEEKYKLEQNLGQCENGYQLELHTARYTIAELQKQVYELKSENTELYKEHTTLIAGSLLQKQNTVKETAKEVLDDLRNIFIEQSSYGSDVNQHIGYYEYEVKLGLVIEQIEEYAKEKYGIEYGVEVE